MQWIKVIDHIALCAVAYFYIGSLGTLRAFKVEEWWFCYNSVYYISFAHKLLVPFRTTRPCVLCIKRKLAYWNYANSHDTEWDLHDLHLSTSHSSTLPNYVCRLPKLIQDIYGAVFMHLTDKWLVLVINIIHCSCARYLFCMAFFFLYNL